MWLQGIIEELDISQKTIKVLCDNQSTIHLTRNQMFHERTKHIDIKYYFVRDVVVQKKLIEAHIQFTTPTRGEELLLGGNSVIG